ncbi:MAG: restriction endonuclease [Novosphingobium sp.]
MNKTYLIASKVVSSIAPFDSPKPLERLIAAVAMTEGLCDAGFEDDFAEKWHDRVLIHLRARLEDASEVGKFAHYRLVGLDQRFVGGSCQLLDSDSQEERKAKSQRAQTILIHRALKALSDNEFELLCQKVPVLLKAEPQGTKPQSNDQGIDFYAKVRFGEIVSPTILPTGSEKMLWAWIIGQAKNYERTVVSTAEIRELVGSVSLARAGIYSTSDNPLSGLSMRLCDPVFYMFLTSGRFTKGSIKLMREAGIAYMEGLELSQYLADCGVGIEHGNFCEVRFANWLESST